MHGQLLYILTCSKELLALESWHSDKSIHRDCSVQWQCIARYVCTPTQLEGTRVYELDYFRSDLLDRPVQVYSVFFWPINTNISGPSTQTFLVHQHKHFWPINTNISDPSTQTFLVHQHKHFWPINTNVSGPSTQTFLAHQRKRFWPINTKFSDPSTQTFLVYQHKLFWPSIQKNNFRSELANGKHSTRFRQ